MLPTSSHKIDLFRAKHDRPRQQKAIGLYGSQSTRSSNSL